MTIGVRVAQWIGRLGLRCYPAPFRRHFGDEMLRTHLERYRALAPHSAARAWFLFTSAVDLVANGIAERFAPQLHSSERSAMRSMLNDVRFAVRSLRRHVGFTALVVITLSLGIGAATAVFSLANATLLRPVPVPDAPSVVSIRELPVNKINPRGPVAYADFADLARLTRTLSGLAAYRAVDLVIQRAVAEQVTAVVTSPNYFTVLGVHAMRGEVFDERRAVTGAEPCAVIAEAFWRSEFGADAGIIGRRVNIAGKLFTIVGIVASDFRGTDLTTDADFWIPMTAMSGTNSPWFQAPDAPLMRAVDVFYLAGRLAHGATPAQASAEVSALLYRIRTSNTQSAGAHVPEVPVDVVPVSIAAAGADRAALVHMMRILMAAVALVLLLACASVANVLLARAADRAGEMSVRAACGASRARIVRHLLIESALLGLLGAALGLGVAWLAMRLVMSFALPGNVRVNHLALGLDRTVLGCSLVLAAATPLVFGLWPAIASTRADISSLLKSHTRRVSRRSAGGVLLAAQVAISLVLLTGALLFLRSVRAALDTNLGFDARGLSAITLSPATNTRSAESNRIYRAVLDRTRALPGVTAAAAASHVPLQRPLSIRMVSVGDNGTPRAVNIAGVSEGYFDLLGVRFIEGRDFGSADRLSTEKRAVINASAAKLFWPGRSPIGQRIGIAFLKPQFASRMQYTVVGVVQGIHYETLNEHDVPAVYAFMDQEPFGTGGSIVTRSADPAATLRALRTVVASVDPALPVLDPRRVSTQIDRALMPQRFGATLLSAFAIVATVICMVGLYGSVIYIVSSRTAEIGIRVALGADGYHVLRLVLGGAGVAIAFGGLVGVVAAALGSGALSRFLYGVSALDPASYELAVGVLLAVATLVAAVPAIRALRIDPAQAVRGME